MGVRVGVVRGSVRAGVNAAVGGRPLEVSSPAQAVGLRFTLVAAGGPTCPQLKPLIAVAVSAAGSCAGQSVAAGVTGVRAVLQERPEGGDNYTALLHFPRLTSRFIELVRLT